LKRYRLNVFGRVQGVGYRYFTHSNATRLNLTGWVKNRFNGTVQIEVQGNSKELELLLSKLKQGPMFGHVDKIEKDEIEIKSNESDFQIVY
jgi:acylphosphatase